MNPIRVRSYWAIVITIVKAKLMSQTVHFLTMSCDVTIAQWEQILDKTDAPKMKSSE